jgi:hypothetical protein
VALAGEREGDLLGDRPIFGGVTQENLQCAIFSQRRRDRGGRGRRGFLHGRQAPPASTQFT